MDEETKPPKSCDGTPICEVHFVRMLCQSTSALSGKQYYKCRVDGCHERATRARPRYRIPPEPHWCDQCAKSGNAVACVVDRYEALTVELACPECGSPKSVDRPDIENQRRRLQREKLWGIDSKRG